MNMYYMKISHIEHTRKYISPKTTFSEKLDFIANTQVKTWYGALLNQSSSKRRGIMLIALHLDHIVREVGIKLNLLKTTS